MGKLYCNFCDLGILAPFEQFVLVAGLKPIKHDRRSTSYARHTVPRAPSAGPLYVPAALRIIKIPINKRKDFDTLNLAIENGADVIGASDSVKT
ncbi:hypothetical protein PoB_001091300 [Plakobranchus ocellatus]|uniref:Uncharacterized protein n=1 Tax=Plakobranchus ocellatus TaxID=259542 RepID=A0AAV3YPD2_9GAST|nr:hypothetical protein PoB_001091300 [Plakobranchus ocellatus]